MKLMLYMFILFIHVPGFSETQTARATFAGGCFWCMEEVFEKVKGVRSVTSGFSADRVEVVEVIYDPDKVEYEKLLDIFWKNIDPLDAEGQFCDRGAEYRSGIFYHDELQKLAAERSKQQVQKKFQEPVTTPVATVTPFNAAGEEHQDYYKKQPFRYKQYKMRCGREERLRAIWK